MGLSPITIAIIAMNIIFILQITNKPICFSISLAIRFIASFFIECYIVIVVINIYLITSVNYHNTFITISLSI